MANGMKSGGRAKEGLQPPSQELLSKVADERRKKRKGDTIESIDLTSYGGIGTAESSLTGSSHLIEVTLRTGETVRILLDCGMFQGKGSEKNPKLAVNPGAIQHVILTHAHLDHSGRLPLLTKEDGEFLGEIRCTPITWDSTLLSLIDTTKIAEDNYEEKLRKYTKLVHAIQEAIKIVRNAENKGVPRRERNGDRIKGTGELDPSIGEGQNGAMIKNRIHGGSAIHDLPERKIQEARELLAEHKFYDLETMTFITGASIKDNITAPTKNLYSVKDVEKLELYVRTHKYDEQFELEPGITATFYNAGHIPGSAMVILNFQISETETYNVMFSGDLGRVQGNFHPFGTPKLPTSDIVDTFIQETTYGGKEHLKRELAVEHLEYVINEAYKKGKKAVIIPTFAIERCATLLHHLVDLKKKEFFDGEIVLDSPLGLKQTRLASKHALDQEFSDNISEDKGHYTVFKGKEREALGKSRKFRVIVTGSGMATGGPVMDYLKLYSNDTDFEFAFVGYQSKGTTGDRLTKGYKSITVDGLNLEVRARIHHLTGFSAHADENDLYAVTDFGGRSRRHGGGKRHGTRSYDRIEQAKLVLVHGERSGSTLAYRHYLERRAKEGKRGIPKPENIYIPELEERINLYSNRVAEIQGDEELEMDVTG